MPGIQAHGWDSDAEEWIEIAVTADGEIIVVSE